MNTNDIINEVLSQIKQPLWENWYIKEKIGSGAFSAVFKVEAQRTSRRTSVSALKIEPITSDGKPFVSEERRRAYIENKRSSAETEAEIMYSLRNCPYIVTYEEEDIKELYINGEFEGYYYLIKMEYLSPVSAMIRNRTFDYSEKNILNFALNIGQGISAAHRLGIIHRDIKLDNFFVDEFGVYKLGDFNISKKTGAARTFAGTPGYLAPEIYLAKSNVDAVYTSQADIYSFGICLYQLMNDLMFPFEDTLETEAAIDKRMEGCELPPPVNASSGFARVILKACEFDAAKRYKTIDELISDLNAVLYAPKPQPVETAIQTVPTDGEKTQEEPHDEQIRLPEAPPRQSPAPDAAKTMLAETEKSVNGNIDEELSDYSVGDGFIEFGSYFFDEGSKRDPIKWKIISLENGKVLLISEMGLDAKKYHHSPGNFDWKSSYLREWLNGDFYNTAFTAAEKKMIVSANLNNYKNVFYRTENGAGTTDNVFLLSIEEAQRLFGSDEERVAVPTELAKKNGAFVGENGGTWWWLRSSGNRDGYAADVDYGGDVDSYGSDKYRSVSCVRPCLWLSLEFLDENKKKSIRESFARSHESFRSISEGNIKNNFTANIVKFGRYFESSINSTSPIEWRVLTVKDDKALIITNKGIDCKAYHNIGGDISWDNSYIRRWLNRDFLSTAFDVSDRAYIIPTTVSNPKNLFYGTESGKITLDKIFLLSVSEAKLYFKDNESRTAEPTQYAKSKGLLCGENGKAWWWLRSSGNIKSYAADVDYGGDVDFYGSSAVKGKNMVRPAMWVDVKVLNNK